MIRNRPLILLLTFIFFLGGFLLAQEESSFSGEIKIIAHYKDRIKNRIFATGNVEIHYKNIKLLADRVELNTETKDVYAEGNVVIQLPDEVVSCEKLRFNLDSTEGELEKVVGMIQPTVFYEAETVERKNENVYSFQKARITSCTQPNPRWNFSCYKANFKKNDYMEMWSSVLSIKKIPIFYFPYMRYPLHKERATGFLMPQIGYSGIKGFLYSQNFYWALARNIDATFNFDYYSSIGLGGGLEYRYLFSRGTGGWMKFYNFFFTGDYFKGNSEQENFERAYLLRLYHNQPLPFNFALTADVDYQSNFDFLREFDNNVRRALVSNRSSQAFISRAWSYFNLNVRVGRFETYYKEIDNSRISYTLPEIGFSSSKIKVFSPLYFSFSSSFKRWENGWESDYKEGEQMRKQDIVFIPTLTLPFTAIPWLMLNSSFSFNFIYDFQSYKPNSGTIVDEPLLSRNYVINMELLGPVFFKIYFDSQNEAKLKHIIEPSFSYRYESPVANMDRIITSGFFSRSHYIRYGLANRILIKQDEMAREVFVLGVSQNFYLEPEEGPLQNYEIDGEIPKFSDIDGYMRFYPATNYSIDFSAEFNQYFMTFSSLRLGASMGSLEDSLYLRVSWYKSINPWYKEAWYNRHQVNCFGGFKIPGISLNAKAEIDFNIQEMEMLYSAVSLVYNYQCFDFGADLRIFFFRERPETQFRITFGLGNIGKTTDFLGGMGF